MGDLVLVKQLHHKPGINTKLIYPYIPKFKGPYQIKTILKKNRFVLMDVPGYNITQKLYNTILSADKIKPWISVKEPDKEINADDASEEKEETNSDTDLSDTENQN